MESASYEVRIRYRDNGAVNFFCSSLYHLRLPYLRCRRVICCLSGFITCRNVLSLPIDYFRSLSNRVSFSRYSTDKENEVSKIFIISLLHQTLLNLAKDIWSVLWCFYGSKNANGFISRHKVMQQSE